MYSLCTKTNNPRHKLVHDGLAIMARFLLGWYSRVPGCLRTECEMWHTQDLEERKTEIKFEFLSLSDGRLDGLWCVMHSGSGCPLQQFQVFEQQIYRVLYTWVEWLARRWMGAMCRIFYWKEPPNSFFGDRHGIFWPCYQRRFLITGIWAWMVYGYVRVGTILQSTDDCAYGVGQTRD